MAPYPTRFGSRFASPAPAAATAEGVAAPEPDAASPPPATWTVMMGVPTSTVCPSGTSSSPTVPSHGIGNSTSDFAVSISTTIWLTATGSPGATFQEMISASVRPSPGSGSAKVSTEPPAAGASAATGAEAAGPAPTGSLSGSAPSTCTVMMGVPTSTVCPSGTSSSPTVPSHGIGNSTSDFAVSISTTIWLTATGSPGATFQEMISASVRPSPGSGSANTFMPMTCGLLRSSGRGRRSRARGPGRADGVPRACSSGTGSNNPRPAARAPPGDRTAAPAPARRSRRRSP